MPQGNASRAGHHFQTWLKTNACMPWGEHTKGESKEISVCKQCYRISVPARSGKHVGHCHGFRFILCHPHRGTPYLSLLSHMCRRRSEHRRQVGFQGRARRTQRWCNARRPWRFVFQWSKIKNFGPVQRRQLDIEETCVLWFEPCWHWHHHWKSANYFGLPPDRWWTE